MKSLTEDFESNKDIHKTIQNFMVISGISFEWIRRMIARRTLPSPAYAIAIIQITAFEFGIAFRKQCSHLKTNFTQIHANEKLSR